MNYTEIYQHAAIALLANIQDRPAALPEQLAAWYATLLHYPTSGVAWALTGIIYCKRSLYALHGKPPYADDTRRAS